MVLMVVLFVMDVFEVFLNCNFKVDLFYWLDRVFEEDIKCFLLVYELFWNYIILWGLWVDLMVIYF